MIASLCSACEGDSHSNCAGTSTTPCSCGCLPSAASLFQYCARFQGKPPNTAA